jgi:hypothetical protein
MSPLLAPGIYFDVPDHAYHADPCERPSLSSTLARVLLSQSAKHAWDKSPRLNPNWQPEIKDTFDFGRAAHALTLGRGAGYKVYPPEVLAKNGAVSTKAAKEWEAETRGAGLAPIKADDEDRMLAMHSVMQEALTEMGITLDPSRSEVTAIAEVDGVMCRARIDNAPADKRRPLVDFKTCLDASPDACIRAVESYGLDFQAAHYLETWLHATGEKRRFLFLFQEKSPPYEVGAVELYAKQGEDADWMQDAYEKTSEARRQWRTCLETGIFPGYPRRIAIVGARTFYRQRWENYLAPERPATTPKPTNETLARASAWQAPTGA